MSFLQSKPADTPSAFGSPQNTGSGAFAAPEARQGPFSLSGFGTTPATGTSAFGQPQLQQNTGFGGFGGTQSTSTFGQQQRQQQQGAFLGQSTGQSGSGFGQTSGLGGASGTGSFGSGLGQSTPGTGGFGGGFGQNTTGTGGFGGFGQQSTFGGGTVGGSFVNQQAQQQQPQGGFFGGGFGLQLPPQQGSAFTQQQPPFGGGWLQPPQQQSQQVQLQAQPSITSITRWSDLPQNYQQTLEALEKYIQTQNGLCEDLKTRSPQLEEYVSSIPIDVAEVQKRFDAISHILAMDATTLNDDLRPKFDQLTLQTKDAIRLLEVLAHPSASSLSYLASTHGAGGDSLIDLFLNKTIEWQTKVDSFKREIAEIDRMLKAVEEGQLGGMASSNSDEIMETLRAQWDGFCGLAARVGKLRERAAEVKFVVERGLRGGRL